MGISYFRGLVYFKSTLDTDESEGNRHSLGHSKMTRLLDSMPGNEVRAIFKIGPDCY
jgi:hypothetical protein